MQMLRHQAPLCLVRLNRARGKSRSWPLRPRRPHRARRTSPTASRSRSRSQCRGQYRCRGRYQHQYQSRGQRSSPWATDQTGIGRAHPPTNANTPQRRRKLRRKNTLLLLSGGKRNSPRVFCHVGSLLHLAGINRFVCCFFFFCFFPSQRAEEAPRGPHRLHGAEGPADEAAAERLRAQPGAVALLEAHPVERGGRGRPGRGPARVLDVLPVRSLASERTLFILHQYQGLGTSSG